jgi:hypothetical protein
MTPAMTAQDIEQLAQQRARRKMGWYTHAFVYVVVNLALALKSAFSGHNWAVYPMLGWGLGLMIHGIVVFINAPAERLREHLVQQERERLQKLQDKN